MVCGKTKKQIADALNKFNLNFEIAQNFKAAVLYAINFAKSFEENITVLLAPACASFDMYDGMAQRGRDFKRLVNNL